MFGSIFLLTLLLFLHIDFGIGNVSGTSAKNLFHPEKVTKFPTKAPTVEETTKKVYCGKPAEKRVISCNGGFYASDVQATCKSHPSPPLNLQIEVPFNKTTRKLSFKVTWERPTYGINTLWGFQVLITPRVGGGSSSCYQINAKTSNEMYFQSDDSILFNMEYDISVVSLPRRDISKELGTNIKKRTPSKCELFREHGLKLPLDCDKCEIFPKYGDNVPFSCRSLNVSVEKNGCHNGSSRVTWDKPKLNIPYRYLVEWESEADGIYNWINVNKSQNGKVLSGLKKDAEYTVTVRMFLSNGILSILSKSTKQMLSCKDVCASNPCRNGGTCVDSINKFDCICKDGYSGKHCETEKKECESNPCQNGRCDDLPGKYSCVCDAGYDGSNCEKDIDECRVGGHDCDSNAVCTNKIGSFSCACNSGYSGNGTSCSGSEDSPVSVSSDGTRRLILYLLVASSFSLVVIGSLSLFLCFKRKQKRRRRGGSESSDRNLLRQSSNNDGNAPTMLLYCAGCERVKAFVLSLASLLNDNGVRVFVDLLESNKIAEIGPAAYHERREEESDYVIIVCTEDTDTSSSPWHTAFNFVLNIIRNNVMIEAKRSKYIPIYMDSKKDGISVVPGFLQSVALKFPNAFENIMQRILGVHPYELINSTSTAAVKNALQINQTMLNPLKTCISGILQNKHQECIAGRCSKGLKSSAVSICQIDEVSLVSFQSRPSSEFSGFTPSQLDVFGPDDDSLSYEFHFQPGMENEMLKVDSHLSVV